ncbi:hypothetical protein Slala03_50140 [Streptomyces lavendulae subsp. lavendulae]|nr:hypothetical protein Slala03_50140 [Streptomyces lavendulae subsp. lavendulae]
MFPDGVGAAEPREANTPARPFLTARRIDLCTNTTGVTPPVPRPVDVLPSHPSERFLPHFYQGLLRKRSESYGAHSPRMASARSEP